MKKVQCMNSISMVETLFFNLLLSFSGGFQDAYTYIVRGKVFANAQTGNIVLISTHLLSGEWSIVLKYLFPILAFVGGVICSDMIRLKDLKLSRITWTQLILLFQCGLLFIVGLLPQSLNLLANALVSFSCAMQVQTFRKFGENTYASTMCIGNLRSGAACLSTYIHTKDKSFAIKCFHYLLIIITFALGAGVCSILTNIYMEFTIWGCFLMLGLCAFILHISSTNIDKNI